MIKKILILMALWISLSESALAKDIKFNSLYGSSNGNNITISTGAIFENFEPNPKDWVAIYKVGDSNSWVNVKLWIWAKEFKTLEDGYGDQYYKFKNVNLPSGKYEVRYFLNNTYSARIKSKPFMIASDEIHGYYAPKNKSLNIEVRKNDFNPNPKDWIGIYKRSDTNDWKNVREWIWAKNLKKNPNNFYDYQFENPDLSSGMYEARYFLNNTFTTHEQSKPFNVKIATDSELYGSHNSHHKTTYIEIRQESFNPNPKDWLGVYRSDDSSDWKNVKEWVWAKDLKKSPGGYYHQFENSKLWGSNYEVRYFLNNTFTVDKRSEPFKGR